MLEFVSDRAPKCTGLDLDAGISTLEKPLFDAVRKSCLDQVRVLLLYGTNTTARDDKGNTVLHVTEVSGEVRMNHPMLAFLIEKMPDEINPATYRGDSPLHAAASMFSHIAGAVQLLIKDGTDVNIRNSSFKSPLHIAAQRRRLKLVNALLLSGTADVDVQDAKGNTPLIICVQSHAGDNTRDNTRLLERLLQNDADVNAQNDDTHTALTFCAVLPKRWRDRAAVVTPWGECE